MDMVLHCDRKVVPRLRKSTRVRRWVTTPGRSTSSFNLATDLHARIITCLCLSDIPRIAQVSRQWASAVNLSNIWDRFCRMTWAQKVHVPEPCCRLRLEGHAREALRMSVEASQAECIAEDLLCSVEWSFHFKQCAGDTWTAVDPWWSGGKARTLMFEPGEERGKGRVKWADDWGLQMWWALYMREGKQVLRVSHEQLGEFPAEIVFRHQNWGYVFNSPWVVYASFPMEHNDETMSDHILQARLEQWQWEEAENYNAGQESSDESDDSGDGDLIPLAD